MKRLVALAGALGILGLAWWFDRLFELARLQAGMTFEPNPMVWGLPVMQLVLAGLAFLLAWFTIFRNGASTLVFLCFLLIGSLLLFSSSLVFSFAAPLSLLPSFLSQALTVFLPVSPRSMLFQASAFTAIIGLIGLAMRRRPSFGK